MLITGVDLFLCFRLHIGFSYWFCLNWLIVFKTFLYCYDKSESYCFHSIITPINSISLYKQCYVICFIKRRKQDIKSHLNKKIGLSINFYLITIKTNNFTITDFKKPCTNTLFFLLFFLLSTVNGHDHACSWEASEFSLLRWERHNVLD